MAFGRHVAAAGGLAEAVDGTVEGCEADTDGKGVSSFLFVSNWM